MTPTLKVDIDPVTHRAVLAWKTWEPYKVKKILATGIVAYGPNLLGAEDSEIISGGFNSKGDHGVALAREANLFHWGPAASPKHMTDEARRVFVNTIVYMKHFDGSRPTVRRGVRPRSLMAIHFNQLVGEYSWLMSSLKQLEKELLDGGNKSEIERRKEKIEAEINLKGRLELFFSPGVVKHLGYDVKKYRELYEPNVGFVYVPHGTSAYTIDEDAKSLGVPNNDVRFLEKCIELLRQPAESAKAHRLLQRYTGLSFADAKGWQEWLTSNRDWLYFSDYYGYRFYTGPTSPAPEPRAVQMALGEREIDEPNEFTPVSVGTVAVGYIVSTAEKYMEADGKTIVDAAYAPSAYRTEKGALVTLVVRLKIADGWHTYASVPENERVDTTKISIELPAGARWHGDWQAPKTFDTRPGVVEYSRDSAFTRQLYFTTVPTQGRDPGQATVITLRGTVHNQACKKKGNCLPPADAPVEAKIIVTDR